MYFKLSLLIHKASWHFEQLRINKCELINHVIIIDE